MIGKRAEFPLTQENTLGSHQTNDYIIIIIITENVCNSKLVFDANNDHVLKSVPFFVWVELGLERGEADMFVYFMRVK